MTTWLIAALAAVLVSLAYVALLRLIDRYEPDPWRYLLAAVALGAFVVPVVVMTGRVLVGQDFTLPLPYASDRPQPGVRIAEQVVSGLVLLAFVYAIRKDFDDALDGVIYGAAIGAGLGATQTILYSLVAFGSGGGLLQASTFVTILLSGLNQALYTAVFGAFLGYAYWYLRDARRWTVIALGLATASLLSAFHDTLPYMLARILDSPDAATGFASRIAAFSLNILGFIGLAIVVVHFIRHESNILGRYLAPEVERETISQSDINEVRSLRSRFAGQLDFLRHGRLNELRLVRHLYRMEGKLAFHLWHERLGRVGADAKAREDELRDQVRRLATAVERARSNDADRAGVS